MNTLHIAYKILYSLEHEKKTDYMGKLISPAALDVPEDKWQEVLETLVDEGYISGVKFGKDILGNEFVDVKHAKITMKGAEYLSENSAMKKIGQTVTNVVTVLKP